VIVTPPTISCAVRDEDEVFAVAEKDNVAVPVPLFTAGVSHEALSDTCHEQPVPVDTFTDPVPPPTGSDTRAGVTL
jgi:hypothetical protein